ncbi:protein phosphatase 2C domain-containing protein [Marinobacteraceae bacterium S3BR75-40.1]
MLTYRMAGMSHRGTVRRQNEDAIHQWLSGAADQAMALLADGMGGQAGGIEASRLAIATVRDLLEQDGSHSKTDFGLGAAVEEANRVIRRARAAEPEHHRMGTTLVAAVCADERLYLANIGDSRCYRFDGEGWHCLTRDHSLVQQMVEEGAMTPAEAERAPMRNILTRALGTEPLAQADCWQLPLAAGQRLLLCSDGLNESVPEEEWQALLAQGNDADQQLERLQTLALERGAPDNISVILIDVETKHG